MTNSTSERPTLQSEKLERPCETFVNPLSATEALHRAILCASCRWPFGEHDNSSAPVVAPQEDASRIPQGALYWLRAAKDESHTLPERLFYMENAYNHVVNALYAAPSPASSPVPEFRNTKEAMEYAARHNMPSVIPVSAAGGDEDGEPLVADMQRALVAAGWIAETAIKWRAPDGSLWRGPYGAWKELQRRAVS